MWLEALGDLRHSAGKLIIKTGSRDAFVELSREPMLLAREHAACDRDLAASGEVQISVAGVNVSRP